MILIDPKFDATPIIDNPVQGVALKIIQVETGFHPKTGNYVDITCVNKEEKLHKERFNIDKPGGYKKFLYLCRAAGLERIKSRSGDEGYDEKDLKGCFIKCDLIEHVGEHPAKINRLFMRNIRSYPRRRDPSTPTFKRRRKRKETDEHSERKGA